MFFRLLDWFLSQHCDIDDVMRMRARLAVGLLLLNILVLLATSSALLLLFKDQAGLTRIVVSALIPIAVIYIGSLIYFCDTLHFSITGNVFLAAQWGALVAGVIFTGGITKSPMMPMLVLLAEYAFLLLGMRGGLWWSAIVFVTLVLLGLLHSLGVHFEAHLSSRQMVFYQIATPILLLTTSAIALVLYETIASSLRRELAIERNEFAYQASHDPLTGLANRDEFQRNLHLAIRQAEMHQRYCAVVYVDLDRFKPINDRFGHASGDFVLCTVSQRLKQTVRDSDTVARLGGDEFAIILMGLQRVDDASTVTRKLHAAIEEPMLCGEQCFEIGASFGIAVYPDMAGSAAELIAAADSAMYAVKSARRDAPPPASNGGECPT